MAVLTGKLLRRFGSYRNSSMHDKYRQTHKAQVWVWHTDDFKLTYQLSMDMGVFAHGQCDSSGQGRSLGYQYFEQAGPPVAAVGKKCGSWGRALVRCQRAIQVVRTGMAIAGAWLKPALAVQAHPAPQSGYAISCPIGPEGKP